MKISKNHHYLPVFYLKGFTQNGCFKIFKPRLKKFKKDGWDFSPKSHYYIENDNTIRLNAELGDYLENSYGESETKASVIFRKIEIGERLSTDDVPYLQYFIAITYWRLPANRGIVKHLGLNRTLRELGLIFKDKNTGIEVEAKDLETQVKADPEYLKWVRQFLPLTFANRFLHCRTPIHILEFDERIPAFCSDNPIILRHPERIDIYLDDFIFPLMHNKILVRIANKVDYRNTLKMKIDVLLMLQATEYVSSTHIEYTLAVHDLYEVWKSEPAKYREHVFSEIEGSNFV